MTPAASLWRLCPFSRNRAIGKSPKMAPGVLAKTNIWKNFFKGFKEEDGGIDPFFSTRVAALYHLSSIFVCLDSFCLNKWSNSESFTHAVVTRWRWRKVKNVAYAQKLCLFSEDKLHYRNITSKSEPCVLRYTDMVNSLATVGEDPNQINQFGEAPLCMAAYRWGVTAYIHCTLILREGTQLQANCSKFSGLSFHSYYIESLQLCTIK